MKLIVRKTSRMYMRQLFSYMRLSEIIKPMRKSHENTSSHKELPRQLNWKGGQILNLKNSFYWSRWKVQDASLQRKTIVQPCLCSMRSTFYLPLSVLAGQMENHVMKELHAWMNPTVGWLAGAAVTTIQLEETCSKRLFSWRRQRTMMLLMLLLVPLVTGDICTIRHINEIFRNVFSSKCGWTKT